jgi:hypothetical protein
MFQGSEQDTHLLEGSQPTLPNPLGAASPGAKRTISWGLASQGQSRICKRRSSRGNDHTANQRSVWIKERTGRWGEKTNSVVGRHGRLEEAFDGSASPTQFILSPSGQSPCTCKKLVDSCKQRTSNQTTPMISKQLSYRVPMSIIATLKGHCKGKKDLSYNLYHLFSPTNQNVTFSSASSAKLPVTNISLLRFTARCLHLSRCVNSSCISRLSYTFLRRHRSSV